MPRQVARSSNFEEALVLDPALTPRERACLEALANGLGNDGIAKKLGICTPTVAMHLSNARRKLGALTREHAIALAMKRHLISV